MQFLYMLEKIRVPVINELMLLVTQFGEETAFLIAALIVFWCVDKRKGYYVMAVGFVGTIANQFLKLAFRVPRPWILDPNFTILEQAREAAAGYSFPSGHSQSAVGTFGAIAYVSKKKWLKYCCVAICVLVPFSRMYIGVHTPKDVLVGALMAVLFIYAFAFVVKQDRVQLMYILIAGMLVLAVGLLLFVNLWDFPLDMDAHNLESGMKNAYTMVGCLLGVAVVYPLERRFVNFTVDGKWWAQILKVIVGFGVVLAVKEGLRAPLDGIFNGHLFSRAVRYFLIVVTAGLLWPMTFKWFSLLGGKNK